MNIIPKELENPHEVRLTSLVNLLLLFLLVMPDDFFGMGTLYSNITPGQIAYKWLDFRFGIVSALLVFWGVATHTSQKSKELILIVLFLIREFLFLINGKSNCFSENAYEIYLVLILAFCMVNIVCSTNITLEEKQLFLWRAAFLNIFIVYVSYLFHLNGIVNRYNAPNMDVEATGVICGLAAVFCLFRTDLRYRYILALVAFGGLVLSGSRVNLLITVCVIALGFFRVVVSKRAISSDVLALSYVAFFTLIGVVIGVAAFNIKIPVVNSDVVERMANAFSFNSMESDSSTLGRLYSLKVGFRIVKDHPVGISGFFTNLQLESTADGFPTFPHSTFLTYYILLGPIILVLIVWMIRLMLEAFEMDTESFLGALYLFMFFCLSGGPIISFKPVFFYILFLMIADKTVAAKKETECTEEGEMQVC